MVLVEVVVDCGVVQEDQVEVAVVVPVALDRIAILVAYLEHPGGGGGGRGQGMMVEELNIPEVAVAVLAVQEHQVLVAVVSLLSDIKPKYLKKL